MAEKVKISIGNIKISVESKGGNADQTASKILKNILAQKDNLLTANIEKPSVSQSPQNTPSSNNFDLGMNTVASIMGASNAPSLTKAAAIFLKLVKNKDTFSRSEITDAMKEASSYYNNTMTKNMSQTLTSLTKSGVLLQRSSGNFGLGAETLAEGQDKLADTG